MPNPQLLYTDPGLATVSAARAKQTFVAEQVAPVLTVAKQSGIIFSSDPNCQRLIPLDTVRAWGGEPNRYVNGDPSRLTYFSHDHSLEGFVSDEEIAQAEIATQMEIDNTEDVTDSLMLKREIELVTKIGTLAQTGVPAVKWDHANGDVVADIKVQKDFVRGKIGVAPNSLVIPSHVLDKIGESATFKARFTNSTPLAEYAKLGDATKLAMLLNIPAENVIVPDCMKNIAAQGQNASLTDVWGNNVLLFYKEAPKLRSQNLMLQIVWNAPGSQMGWKVDLEPVLKRNGRAIYVHNWYDQMLLNPLAGYWFTAVLT